MLPGFGVFELMVLAGAALIVVGPKDLPRLMRGLGKFIAQARGLAREFQAGFEQMAREAELDDLRKEVEALKRHNPLAEAKRAADEAMKPISEELNAPLKTSGATDPEPASKSEPAPETETDAQAPETEAAPKAS